jgi:protein-tyrosine phosphatase
MDLIGGVGEIPISLPQNIGSQGVAALPTWLKRVACDDGGPKAVADRFLRLEEDEKERMQEALNVSVVYDSPTSTATKPHALAGVEKGTKNRYNNIWPYDHARVKLIDYPQDECDYVNASHISAQYTPKRYIASQAPLPTTFRVGGSLFAPVPPSSLFLFMLLIRG